MSNRLYKKGLAVVLIIALLIMTAVGIKLSGKEEQMVFTSYENLENENKEITEITEEKSLNSHIFIDIDGAVKKPGVYQLKDGDRVNDAIIMAGGLTENAYTKNLNKARKLVDGEKIYIINVSEIEISSDDNKLININTASINDLMSLPSIGEVYAQRIIDYRNNKFFTSIEEIKNIEGIGDKTFEKIKDLITIEWWGDNLDNNMQKEEIRLTQMTKASGWAAKIGPETLAQVLSKLPKFKNDKLIVGLETSDDACVYKINDELAMIQTVDFFTPVVDDPYTFGQIAAANSLSDIYAMGGEPTLALNIIGFPNCLSPDVMAEILKGGASKVIEAGATIAGGHSVEDDEPKYGMCVTGFIEPSKVLKNYGAKPGDVLILTKPIGTGIINTAYKAGMCSIETENEAIHVMASLNKNAKRVIEHYPINCCTDITGFGLAGHSAEMAEASNVTFELYIKKVPVIGSVFEYAETGLVPAGSYRNRKYFSDKVCIEDIEEKYVDLAFDPQTSGGLMFSVNEKYAEEILEKLEENLDTEFALIGKVTEKIDNSQKYIIIKN